MASVTQRRLGFSLPLSSPGMRREGWAELACVGKWLTEIASRFHKQCQSSGVFTVYLTLFLSGSIRAACNWQRLLSLPSRRLQPVRPAAVAVHGYGYRSTTTDHVSEVTLNFNS